MAEYRKRSAGGEEKKKRAVDGRNGAWKTGGTRTAGGKTRAEGAKTGGMKTGGMKSRVEGTKPSGVQTRTDGKKATGAKPRSEWTKTAGMKSRPDGTKASVAKRADAPCPIFHKCGGCKYLNLTYEEQLALKQRHLSELLKPYGKLEPMLGMEHPWHYRNKVHAAFDHDKRGNAISGVYEEKTHRVLPMDHCLIEDELADRIIVSVRTLLRSFKIKTYDESNGCGLLRRVLVKRGFTTGEVMVVLVLTSPILPSSTNFVKALRKLHPEITTILINVNDRHTSMILGNKEKTLYGRGYIEDVLCGKAFRVSAKSFYQINPVMTEKLYSLAIDWAGLTGKETVLDAYCGIGTIGLIASDRAGEVIGVELNADAVRDAVWNAKRNEVKNARFYCADATQFITDMAAEKQKLDVIFMDPPRSGSTPEFLAAVNEIRPKKLIYISCNPDTLARDLEVLGKMGWKVERMKGVDCFAWTEHVECVCLMTKSK